MKKFMFIPAFLILNILLHISCSSGNKIIREPIIHYVPENKELYDAIVYHDSLFFDAYNHCRMDEMRALISEDVEFYHDKGGLSTVKADILSAIEHNICNKVTRELIKGSIEVYPIKGYGAVQMGQHRFYNRLENPGVPSRPGKFVTTWQNKEGQWKMTRIISLH